MGFHVRISFAVERFVAAVVVAVAVCALSGCGGTTTISTDAAKETLRAAGFSKLVVHNDQPDAPDTNRIGNYSDVTTTRPGWPLPSIELLRYRSSRTAAKVYTGFSRPYFRSLIAYWRHPPKLCDGCIDGTRKLPRDFHLRKVMAFRICNVILWSYNAQLDPHLTTRVNRAATLLAAKCR